PRLVRAAAWPSAPVTTRPADAQSSRYTFVDHLSSPAPPGALASAAATAVRDGLVAGTLERDVRVLAAPEMRGRLRGTEENARARAHIVERLKRAGLAPLFDGSFEQPTRADGAAAAATPYATHAGAALRAPRAGAA